MYNFTFKLGYKITITVQIMVMNDLQLLKAKYRSISTFIWYNNPVKNNVRFYSEERIPKKRRSVEWNAAIPYEKIPGPKPLPILGNMYRFMFGEYQNVDFREVIFRLYKDYGKIAILRKLSGRQDALKLYDPKDVETLYRNESLWPYRVILPSFDQYRLNVRKEEFKNFSGLLSMQGEEWFKARRKTNPILMKPNIIKMYIEPIDAISMDFVELIKKICSSSEVNEVPEDFNRYIQKFVMECIGVISFNQRLGCLCEEPDELTKKFIDTINEVFASMQLLDFTLIGTIYKKLKLKPWYRFIQQMDALHEIGRQLQNRAQKGQSDTPQKLGILGKLLQIDKEFALTFNIDMFLVGIVATTKSMGILMYLLAKNQNCHTKLHEELKMLMPSVNSQITAEVLNHAPYLKAVIKESMRLLPISLGTIRVTSKDMVLGGYQVPKGTVVETGNVIMSNSEENYKSAKDFIPERWLRSTTGDLSYKQTSAFVTMPFGVGLRSCIGKRLAYIIIEIFTAKIFRNYRVEWPHKDMTFKTNVSFGCADPLKFKMTTLS